MPDYSQMKQEDLVELAKQGDQFAYERLYQEYGPQLCTYLQRIFGNEEDAQDITQEAFLTAWQKLRSLRKNHYFKTWLCSIATNAARKRLLQTRPQLWLSLEEHEQIIPMEDKGGLTLEESVISKIIMQKALLYLSPKYRFCVLLQIVEDLPQRKIAELLGMHEKHIATYVQRGLERLGEALRLLEQAQNIPERKRADL